MFINYIKVALRNLVRNKAYSVINVMGLAVGMAVTMLIGIWVYDELSHDTTHENYSSIAQVYQHYLVNNEVKTIPLGAVPLGIQLRSAYKDDFKHVVMSWWHNEHVLAVEDKVEDKKISRVGTFMQPAALEMFSFRMVKGSWSSLNDPASIILSTSAAKALFGDEDPINKILRVDNLMDVKVTGIFKEFPYNSSFHSLQFLSTWDLWVASNDWMQEAENSWENTAVTYVQLQPGKEAEETSEKIKDIRRNQLEKGQAEKEKPQVFLHPMSRWHLYSEWKNGAASGGRVEYVWLFTIIGIFVLLLACINFMNLSTAQSERRAREVGIRKSIGSVRGQLIYQFLAESFSVVVFAFVFAIALVTAALPWFNSFANKDMGVMWTNGYFWLAVSTFIVVTSLLAGSYPALYLSSFQPVKVLKGTFKAGRFAAVPRRALVVMQFTVSIALIIGTVVVWQQIQFAKNRPVGYTREGLIMVRKKSPEFWGKYNTLKNELKASEAVVEMAESSSPATETWFSNSGIVWQGKDPNQDVDFATMAVTHEYGKTMGWKFIQGRDYTNELATDSSAVILNETAVQFMGLEKPIDEEITWNGKKYTVIGVIQDMIIDSPYEPVKPTIFWLNYKGNVWMNMRINPALSTSSALETIENVFNKVVPSVLFDYTFVDQEFALKFAQEEALGEVAGIFSLLAVFISCLGLFGMASYVAEQRKKEIGIRKIVGATVLNLWKMLSGEFLGLVMIACFISMPIAWYFLTEWLNKYEYHIVISVWTFVLASMGALVITILTISYQLIKACMVNPVKSLRSE